MVAPTLLLAVISIFAVRSGHWPTALKLNQNPLERIYVPAYSLICLADWLQGSYLYALYVSYGYDLIQIKYLYLVGFACSAISGPLIGALCDNGKKKYGCVAYCFLNAFSCLTKISSNMFVLILGHVLSGASTSLLHTVFESWLVASTNSTSCATTALPALFAKLTFLNGLIAIFSGLMANLSITMGLMSPFILSIIASFAALFIICFTWDEPTSFNLELPGIIAPVFKSSNAEYSLIGIVVAHGIFESAMYLIVFSWGFLLDANDPEGKIPYGLIFSSFMTSIMIGSQFFAILSKRCSLKLILNMALLLAATCFALLSSTQATPIVYTALNIFEFCCGLFFPALSAIKATHIPENTRVATMNNVRVPVNILAIISIAAFDAADPFSLFSIYSILLIVASIVATFCIDYHSKNVLQV